MIGRRRYSSIWHAIMRDDEIETDTNETHAEVDKDTQEMTTWYTTTM